MSWVHEMTQTVLYREVTAAAEISAAALRPVYEANDLINDVVVSLLRWKVPKPDQPILYMKACVRNHASKLRARFDQTPLLDGIKQDLVLVEDWAANIDPAQTWIGRMLVADIRERVERLRALRATFPTRYSHERRLVAAISAYYAGYLHEARRRHGRAPVRNWHRRTLRDLEIVYGVSRPVIHRRVQPLLDRVHDLGRAYHVLA